MFQLEFQLSIIQIAPGETTDEAVMYVRTQVARMPLLPGAQNRHIYQKNAMHCGMSLSDLIFVHTKQYWRKLEVQVAAFQLKSESCSSYKDEAWPVLQLYNCSRYLDEVGCLSKLYALACKATLRIQLKEAAEQLHVIVRQGDSDLDTDNDRPGVPQLCFQCQAYTQWGSQLSEQHYSRLAKQENSLLGFLFTREL